jgi:hypothetical protein
MDRTVKCKLPSKPQSTDFRKKFNILHGIGEILNLKTSADEFILQLSWNFQFVPFHKKRGMVPQLKKACALNKKKWAEVSQIEF